MKSKVVILSVVLSLLFAGIVSAATSLWGTYKGKQIIRLTVDGVPTKVSDAPAVLMDGRTMVPLYLLKEAGIEYNWDAKNQTVNIKSNKPSGIPLAAIPDVHDLPKETTIKDIYKLANSIGYVEGFDSEGKVACSGSGVMVYPNIFITNYHVANCGGSGVITAKIDGKVYNNSAEGWYTFENEANDLYGIVLSTSFNTEGYPTGDEPEMVFNIVDTDLPEVGDKIYTIGSPYGLENTVSQGVVSGIRVIDGLTYIQHTADTEEGSSGGALMDKDGYLIGITSSGFEGTNLDFAIPISYVKAELDKLDL